MINKRLFGAPINEKVQEELNNKKKGYLGEKLPFIRMWVAPKLVGMAEYTELLQEKLKIDQPIPFTEEEVKKLTAKKFLKMQTYATLGIDEDEFLYKNSQAQLQLANIPESTGTPGSNNNLPLPGAMDNKLDYFKSIQIGSNKAPNIRDSIAKNNQFGVDPTSTNTDGDQAVSNDVIYQEDEPEIEDVKEELLDAINEDELQTLQKKAEQEARLELSQRSKKVEKIVTEEKITRDKVPYNQVVYVVGNVSAQGGKISNRSDFNYKQKTIDAQGNETYSEDDSTATTLSQKDLKSIEQKLFPNELSDNKLFKPAAGITSLSSETEGTLGVIKKTTVNFVVHNFRDFDTICNRYFLKPGTNVFVDFGWSDVDLYNPTQLIEESEQKGIEYFLYNEPKKDKDNEFEGYVARNLGSLEVICGIVTDYSAKITKNGSVECSITLTSQNSALLGFNNDSVQQDLVDFQLTTGIYQYGLKSLVAQLPTKTPEEKNLKENILKAINQTISFNQSTDLKQTYEDNLAYLYNLNFGLTNTVIPDKCIEFGFFTNGLDVTDNYMTWGRIEDLIFNGNFGHGKDDEDINSGTNFNIRMDSSQAYTSYSNYHAKIQKAKISEGKDIGHYFFPQWWGKSNPSDNDGSYSWEKEKYPQGYLGISKNDKPETDENFGKIPLREVFIRVELVKDAFKAEKNKSIKMVIKQLLESINKASGDLFNWAMLSGDTDSKIQIIDKNYVFNKEMKKKIKTSGTPFYIMNIMTKNSIVKDYNLEFKIPSGKIGDMYAIRNLGPENNIYSTKTEITNLVAQEMMDRFAPQILSFPDHGGKRAENNINDSNNTKFINIFNNEDLIGGELRTLSSGFSTNKFNVGANSPLQTLIETNPEAILDNKFEGLTDDQVKKVKKTSKEKQTTVDGNNRALQSHGYIVYDSLSAYREGVGAAKADISIPQLLPYTLSLSIHGIASIIPGDTFQVDYLPLEHRSSTYLQTIKVTHDIQSGDWTTGLETQYRQLFPDSNNDILLQSDTEEQVVSPNIFLKQPFDIQKGLFNENKTNTINGRMSPIFNNDYWTTENSDSAVDIKDFIRYMIMVRPLEVREGSALSHRFQFRFIGASNNDDSYFINNTLDDTPGFVFNQLRVDLKENDLNALNNQLKNKGMRTYLYDSFTKHFIQEGSKVTTATATKLPYAKKMKIDVDTIIQGEQIYAKNPDFKYKPVIGPGGQDNSDEKFKLYKYSQVYLPPFAVRGGSLYQMWIRNSNEFGIVPDPSESEMTTTAYNALLKLFEDGSTVEIGKSDNSTTFTTK